MADNHMAGGLVAGIVIGVLLSSAFFHIFPPEASSPYEQKYADVKVKVLGWDFSNNKTEFRLEIENGGSGPVQLGYEESSICVGDGDQCVNHLATSTNNFEKTLHPGKPQNGDITFPAIPTEDKFELKLSIFDIKKAEHIGPIVITIDPKNPPS